MCICIHKYTDDLFIIFSDTKNLKPVCFQIKYEDSYFENHLYNHIKIDNLFI